MIITLTAKSIANSASFVRKNHGRPLHHNDTPDMRQRLAATYNMHLILEAQEVGAEVPMGVIDYASEGGNIDPRWTLAELVSAAA